MRLFKLALLAGLAVGAAACILKSTQHTLYLEPDGSVVWTVLEEDVHSNEADAAKRRQEECDWLAAAEAGDHGVGRGLALLGGVPVTRILRAQTPFTVWTRARFDSLDELGHRLVDGLGLPARFEASSAHGASSFTLELDLASAEAMDTDDNPFLDLLDGLEHTRLVLPEGRFLGGEGFEIDEDGRVARPLPPPEELLAAKAGTFRWSLRWSLSGAGHPAAQGAAGSSAAETPEAAAGHEALEVSGRGAPVS